MTEREFDIQMNRLIAVYSDRGYPDERRKILWREFRMIDGRDFQELVTEMIANNATAPMVSKFREAKADIFRKREPEIRARREKWVADQPNCGYCAKLGYFTARNREDNYSAAFQCVCGLGERLCPKYPKWTEAYADAYHPEYASASAHFVTAKQFSLKDAVATLAHGMRAPEPRREDYSEDE